MFLSKIVHRCSPNNYYPYWERLPFTVANPSIGKFASKVNTSPKKVSEFCKNRRVVIESSVTMQIFLQECSKFAYPVTILHLDSLEYLDYSIMIDNMNHAYMLCTNAYETNAIRNMERTLLSKNVPSMHMAAHAIAQRVLSICSEQSHSAASTCVTVLAGAGNNGADALFAAVELSNHAIDTRIIMVADHLHDEAHQACQNAHIPITAFNADNAEAIATTIIQSNVILDAIAGIGSLASLHGNAQTLVEAINAKAKNHAKPYILAIDTPSGVGINDGSLPGVFLKADETITFGALKPCLLLPPAAYICGHISILDFDFALNEYTPTVIATTSTSASRCLSVATDSDSKYSRGVLTVITGSEMYPGAAVLGSAAAARAGIGMVRYVGPVRAQNMVLHTTPEVVASQELQGHCHAYTVGSGVPDKAHTTDASSVQQRTTIAAILAKYGTETHEQATSQSNSLAPICVDAGALDLLPQHVYPEKIVITPHAGELASLLQRYDVKTTADEIAQHPRYFARKTACLTGATVLVKGAISLIASPDSTQPIYTSSSAPSWLATAGAGDVLAGILGALLAQNAMSQHTRSLSELAANAATIHGLAASYAANSNEYLQRQPTIAQGNNASSHIQTHYGHPIIASDMLEALPLVLETLLS